jgi:hypothetical protein
MLDFYRVGMPVNYLWHVIMMWSNNYYHLHLLLQHARKVWQTEVGSCSGCVKIEAILFAFSNDILATKTFLL